MLALDQSYILCKSLLKFTLVFSEVTVWMTSSGSGIVVRLWAVLKSLSHCDRWNAYAQCHQGPKQSVLEFKFPLRRLTLHAFTTLFGLIMSCLFIYLCFETVITAGLRHSLTRELSQSKHKSAQMWNYSGTKYESKVQWLQGSIIQLSDKFEQIKSLLLSHHHSTCALRACSRQCRNNLHLDSTYLQTYTDDNVQNTHTYTQYTQCTIRHTYSYQYTLYTVCTHSTLCTHIYIHTIISEKSCNRLYISRICSVMNVHWMVSSDSR